MQPEELLHRLVHNDKAAFQGLYDLFKDKVYNTCISYLQNSGDAEEVTQDVFLEVYHSAKSFKGSSSVSTWIYRIAVNKCIDKIRYKGRQKRQGFIASIFNKDTGELEHDPAGFNHPGVVYENKEKAAMLFRAIEQLPENQKTAFILKQVEGLSQQEVADVMELTQKAVESLIQRAKANLRKLLKDFYNDAKD